MILPLLVSTVLSVKANLIFFFSFLFCWVFPLASSSAFCEGFLFVVLVVSGLDKAGLTTGQTSARLMVFELEGFVTNGPEFFFMPK